MIFLNCKNFRENPMKKIFLISGLKQITIQEIVSYTGNFEKLENVLDGLNSPTYFTQKKFPEPFFYRTLLLEACSS